MLIETHADEILVKRFFLSDVEQAEAAPLWVDDVSVRCCMDLMEILQLLLHHMYFSFKKKKKGGYLNLEKWQIPDIAGGINEGGNKILRLAMNGK